MHAPIPEADLVEKIAAAVKAAGGTVITQGDHSVNGTLTAITSKWFLGGRKVTDSVTCRLRSWHPRGTSPRDRRGDLLGPTAARVHDGDEGPGWHPRHKHPD